MRQCSHLYWHIRISENIWIGRCVLLFAPFCIFLQHLDFMTHLNWDGMASFCHRSQGLAVSSGGTIKTITLNLDGLASCCQGVYPRRLFWRRHQSRISYDLFMIQTFYDQNNFDQNEFREGVQIRSFRLFCDILSIDCIRNCFAQNWARIYKTDAFVSFHFSVSVL